jgi:hypothetical protein
MIIQPIQELISWERGGGSSESPRAPVIIHCLHSWLTRVKTSTMLGLAPSKTHLLRWFQIIHASKIISNFNPFLFSPKVAEAALSHLTGPFVRLTGRISFLIVFYRARLSIELGYPGLGSLPLDSWSSWCPPRQEKVSFWIILDPAWWISRGNCGSLSLSAVRTLPFIISLCKIKSHY